MPIDAIRRAEFLLRWGVEYHHYQLCINDSCSHNPCNEWREIAFQENMPECSEEELIPPRPSRLLSFLSSFESGLAIGIEAAAEVVRNMPNTDNEITHFEMEIKRTPSKGTTVHLRSPFVESLMRALSEGVTAAVSNMASYGWPRNANAVYRIPNMYLSGVSANGFRQYNQPIVFGGFNPTVLCIVGLGNGLTFKITEPMSDKAYDVFAERVASTIKQLIEAFGVQSSRIVKVIGDESLSVDTHQH